MRFKKDSVSRLLCIVIICLSFTACKERNKQDANTGGIKTGGKEVYTDSSASSVKVFDQNGRVCVQQSSTSFEVTNVYDGATKIPMLLKIKKTELCYADSTNGDKVYEITGKSILDSKSIGWTTQFVANGIQFSDNTLLAVREGGESEEDYLRRFSLLNGKEVSSGSYGEIKVKIPNVKDRRFVAYTSKKASSAPLKEQAQENLLATVHYGSSTAAINGFKIMLKRSKIADKIPTGTPDMVFVAGNVNATVIEDGKALILMKADEHYTSADVKDFSVKFTLYYGDDNESTNIIVPIADDKLDISKAQYDKDIFELAAF